MLQKLNRKNGNGEELYQEVTLLDKTKNHAKEYGAIGTLKQLQKPKPVIPKKENS